METNRKQRLWCSRGCGASIRSQCMKLRRSNGVINAPSLSLDRTSVTGKSAMRIPQTPPVSSELHTVNSCKNYGSPGNARRTFALHLSRDPSTKLSAHETRPPFRLPKRTFRLVHSGVRSEKFIIPRMRIYGPPWNRNYSSLSEEALYQRLLFAR